MTELNQRRQLLRAKHQRQISRSMATVEHVILFPYLNKSKSIIDGLEDASEEQIKILVEQLSQVQRQLDNEDETIQLSIDDEGELAEDLERSHVYK